ncbi:MAG: hypothetical protein ACI8UO_003722 [Verrucomicrobiales bacterium]|jgi:hypothetical protein
MNLKSNILLGALALIVLTIGATPESQAQGFSRSGSVHGVNSKNWQVGGAMFSWGTRSGRHAWNVSNLTTLFDPPSGVSGGWQQGYYYVNGVNLDGSLGLRTAGIYYRSGRYVIVRDLWNMKNGRWAPVTNPGNYRYHYEG